MADRELLGVAVTAKIGGHPIHPMLVPFPIALLVAAFGCDVIYWVTGRSFWAEAGLWSLGAALVGAALAALAGLTDFLGNARIRSMGDAWKHMIGNVTAVVLAIVNLGLRLQNGAEAAIVPWGLALSAVIVGLLVYTGWKGGEMVYRRRIGMQPEAPAERSAHEPMGHAAHR